MANQRRPQPRRLLVLYLLTTLVPAASLGWLGWRVADQDRLLEARRNEERRDRAADLAATALQRILAEAEETLTTFSAAGSRREAGVRDGATLLIFTSAGVTDRAGTPLPYYPVTPSPSQLPSARLAEAQDLEFRRRDLISALRILGEVAASADPIVRGEATLRLARIHRKMGNAAVALEAFARLGELGQIRVDGAPAGLIAAQGRALILEAEGRTDELRRAATALCGALTDGRWLVSRAEFEFGYEQTRRWGSCPPVPAERIAVAAAAESLWQQRRMNENQPARDRRTFRSGDQSVLMLTRASPGRMAAMLIAPAFLASAWRRALTSTAGEDVEFALTDADGRPVLGRADVSLVRQSVRPSSATELPWTVHAIDVQPAARTLSGRTRVLIGGLGVMAVIVLAGGYAINRAILREVRVAKLQSDFVAAVSHEFRTPLTTLRQLSEMLVRGRVSTDERRQQFYETLLQESERLQRLVESLLNFGRMEAGELHYHFEPLETGAFLRDVVSDFQREVTARGYRVELRDNGALPSIRADRDSLARVFWNLLDNAVKYSPDHKVVWVEPSNGGKRLLVRVRDRGLGISEAERHDIFRKFVRGGASQNASIRGTGIGLTIARQIVEAHGGGISVESQPGEGSVFTVVLPVAAS